MEIAWTPEIEKKLSEWLIRWSIYTGENWIIHCKRAYAKVTIISDKGNRALVLFRRSSWTAMDVRRDGIWKKDGWRRDGEPFFRSIPSFKFLTKPLNGILYKQLAAQSPQEIWLGGELYIYKNLIYSDSPHLIYSDPPHGMKLSLFFHKYQSRIHAEFGIVFRISKPQPKSPRMLRFIEEKEDL